MYIESKAKAHTMEMHAALVAAKPHDLQPESTVMRGWASVPKVLYIP